MSWLAVFSACLAAVLLGGGLVALGVAWIVGRSSRSSRADPMRLVMENMPEYPVNEEGELKTMERPTELEEVYEPMNLRI